MKEIKEEVKKQISLEEDKKLVNNEFDSKLEAIVKTVEEIKSKN